MNLSLTNIMRVTHRSNFIFALIMRSWRLGMKKVPNYLTILRIILTLGLPFLIYQKWIFIVLFLLCGITDVLDGYIARKFDCKTTFGAKLDSAADTVLFITLTGCIFLMMGDKLRHYLIWILAIIAVRVANVLIAFVKDKCFLMIHTLANKGTGMCIYIVVLFYQIYPMDAIVYIALVFALLSALEETLIHITQKKPDPNRRGLFLR